MDSADHELQEAFSDLILSASGWRKIFAQSGRESDGGHAVSPADCAIAFLAARSFTEFLQAEYPAIQTIVVGRDSRPTGPVLIKEALQAFTEPACTLTVQSIGICAAPEIMAYARSIGAAFMYISASHNPIGHNGIKFGLNTGGVLNGIQSARLIALFTDACSTAIHDGTDGLRLSLDEAKYRTICENEAARKQDALTAYHAFLREVIAASADQHIQEQFFAGIRAECAAFAEKDSPFTLIADFNGSARAASIDRVFFETLGMRLIGLSEKAGDIKHGIVPEGDNLQTCVEALTEIHRKTPEQAKHTLFGYMPDCDGDRGIIIYWDEAEQKALPLDAQEVFALSVMAELSYLHYAGKTAKPLAVAVNGPTSLRINTIAAALEAEVFYSEVGEANTVNRAADLRGYGYEVRILGEGSNGGNITHPAAVRDPLNTLFAIIKTLLIKDKSAQPCPFRIWCEKSGQMDKYRADFSLSDIIATLPAYRTTSTQEQRAILHIHTTDHAALKRAYQYIFMREWAEKQPLLKKQFGIYSCKVFSYNGTTCTENPSDFGLSGKGGLKIQFYSAEHEPLAFIWMRGSATEPLFRIIADVKGCNAEAETYLVNWQGTMVREADASLSDQLGKDGT